MTDSKRDYYEVLGVQRDVPEGDLKKAYRRKAMKLHPDRNAENKEAAAKQFQEVQEAYAVLSDPSKRQAYDQYGHAGVDASMGGGGPGAAGFNFSDLGDIFGNFFGGGDVNDMFGGGRQGSQRGADLGYELALTLEEAVHGVAKKIRVPTWISCGTCKGSGAKAGKGPVKCKHCKGAGQVQMRHGFIAVQQACPACRGQGSMIEDPCGTCRGQGRTREERTLSVKIPAGVDNGARVRLTGKGEAGLNGAPSGDLYVQIVVKPHKIFERDRDDLHCEVPIDFVSATIGGEIEVPTLDGQVKLKIPAETQSGKRFRLRGKGVKSVQSHSTGDLICHVVIETPVKLDAEQKALLTQFRESLTKDSARHSPKSSNWFNNVKNFFG